MTADIQVTARTRILIADDHHLVLAGVRALLQRNATMEVIGEAADGHSALRLAIDHLVAEHGHHRFTIDPEAGNEVAIRCYEAVGFKPVGLMRRYSRRADGTWVDGLLMELIVEQNL